MRRASNERPSGRWNRIESDWDQASFAATGSPIALLRCGRDGIVAWANAAATRLLGLKAGGLVFDHVAADHRRALAAFFDSFDRGDRRARLQVETATGLQVELLANCEEGDMFDVAAYDMSGFLTELEQVRRAARTDSLTGLLNRTGLTEIAGTFGRGVERGQLCPAVAVVDLDRFKDVNDRFGHVGGDDVLRQVAQRLGGLLEGDEVAARIGGDEFVVCFPDGGPERAKTFGARLLECLSECFSSERRDINVSASIGIATVDADAHFDRSLREADVALYRAKAAGRASVQVYSPHDDNAFDVHRLTKTVARLQKVAHVDDRTRLLRDHVFAEDLHALHGHALRNGSPLSMVLVDLDNFHDYNARYLYESGHRTLRKVADAISGCVRDGDRCYRYGGEELAVLLEGVELPEATETGERLREIVERLGIPHEGTTPGVVTVSVGVCTLLPPGTDTTPESLVRGANLALLAAKAAGRNCVRQSLADVHSARPTLS